jgi:uncharacterized membrane protein (UPF0127 family)
MQPRDERKIESKTENVHFVLEMNQGWFEKNKLAPGTLIRTEIGGLYETFFGRQR